MIDTREPQIAGPGPAHRRMNVFIGKWHAEGKSYADGQRMDDPLASAVPWTSDESYEWLPGSFFVLHRWDATAGKRVFKGIEVIGYDDAAGGYFVRFFDNAGFHPEYRAAVDGNVWTFTGSETRATVRVSDNGDSMTFRWEWRKGGGDWLPLCDRVAKRVG